jgi:hypothetical protein
MALLLGTQNLVVTLRNANKHFWRHCQGWHWLKDLLTHNLGYVSKK